MLVIQTSGKKHVDTKARKDADYIHTKLAVLAPDNVKVLNEATVYLSTSNWMSLQPSESETVETM